MRLVTGIGEVKKLNGNLLAFQVVLKDAKQRQMKDNKAVDEHNLYTYFTLNNIIASYVYLLFLIN